jgi:DNA (cytosine-5)-methyltransferase 1
LTETENIAVEKIISGLPAVRSGLSREEDGSDIWVERILQILSRPFMNGKPEDLDGAVGKKLKDAVRSIRSSSLSRGGEFIKCKPLVDYRPDWFLDPRLGGVCYHMTRVHISDDLHRYLFAACYASEKGRSPILRDFPEELFPKHKNAKKSAKDGGFDDRFHVQLADRPATTVTSHLAKDGHYFIHPDPSQCRSMTVREVARIQTFPDNYAFTGSRSAQYIQVGNAVPPLLAHQIAGSLFTFLKGCGFAE